MSEQLAEGCYLKAGQTRDLPVASHTENHNTAVGIYVTRRTLLVDYDIPRARWRPAVGRKFDDAERGLTASIAPCITAPAARYQASQTAEPERVPRLVASEFRARVTPAPAMSSSANFAEI